MNESIEMIRTCIVDVMAYSVLNCIDTKMKSCKEKKTEVETNEMK